MNLNIVTIERHLPDGVVKTAHWTDENGRVITEPEKEQQNAN